MKSINTKLDDELYDKIIASGQTPYKFLQDAAREKLNEDEKKKEFEDVIYDIVSALNIRLESFEEEMAISNKIAREKLAIIANKIG